MEEFDIHLRSSFQPYLEAVRNVFIKFLYTSISTILLLILSQIISWIAWRQWDLHNPSIEDPLPNRKLPHMSVLKNSGITNLDPAVEGSDCESVDNDTIEITRQTTVTNITVFKSSSRGGVSGGGGSCSGGGLAAIRYTETNV